MDLKQRSRYLLIDPDKKPEEKVVEYEKEFETILDKIEYELNQEDVFLTDGFYSSGEEEDKDDESKQLHMISKSSSSESQFASVAADNVRNWYPELDIDPAIMGQALPENPEITHSMVKSILLGNDILQL